MVENSEVKDAFVQDMLEVLTCFCARLYGRRSARKKAKQDGQETELPFLSLLVSPQPKTQAAAKDPWPLVSVGHFSGY